MIIIINGPPAAGKTTIAKELVQRIDECIYIDGDAILNFITHNNTSRVELKITLFNILLLIGSFKNSGYQNFVVDFVFEKMEEINSFKNLAYLLDIKFYSFYLFASFEYLCMQNLKRDGEDFIDPERIKELYLLFLEEGYKLGKRIYVEGKNVDMIITEIKNII